jgi:hypothetical protein
MTFCRESLTKVEASGFDVDDMEFMQVIDGPCPHPHPFFARNTKWVAECAIFKFFALVHLHTSLQTKFLQDTILHELQTEEEGVALEVCAYG